MSRRFWSRAELKYLQENWLLVEHREVLVRELGRSLKAISNKATDLGLPSRRRQKAPSKAPVVLAWKEEFPPRQDEHVAAVLGHGGFPALPVKSSGIALWFDGERFRKVAA